MEGMRITAFEEQPSALRSASLPRFTEDGMSASLPEVGRKVRRAESKKIGRLADKKVRKAEDR